MPCDSYTFAHALHERTLALVVGELGIDHRLLRPQRVDDVHREHDAVERLGGSGRHRRRRRRDGSAHEPLRAGRAAARSWSAAMRQRPVAAVISSAFFVLRSRISSMICSERSW